MRKKMIATVHILLDTENDDEADDVLSRLLTENGICGIGTGVIEWAYTQGADGTYRYARPIEIPDAGDFADVADLADYIAEHERERNRETTAHEELIRPVPAPCADGRLELLRRGLVCEFMSRRWRLLTGEAIEDALREAWREGGDDGGDAPAGEDAFLAWALEGDRLVDFLPAAMGMDSFADTFWDRLRGAADELLQQHRHARATDNDGTHDAELCAEHP